MGEWKFMRRMLEKSFAISARERKSSGRAASWDARNWDLDPSFSCHPFCKQHNSAQPTVRNKLSDRLGNNICHLRSRTRWRGSKGLRKSRVFEENSPQQPTFIEGNSVSTNENDRTKLNDRIGALAIFPAHKTLYRFHLSSTGRAKNILVARYEVNRSLCGVINKSDINWNAD